MNSKFNIVFIALLVICILNNGCKSKNNIIERINYYHLEKNPYQTGRNLIDTVYQEEILQIESKISIRKHILDSLITNRLLNKELLINDLGVSYEGCFEKTFENEELLVYKFLFRNNRAGYYATILYNPTFAIILRDYHGHGRIYLDSLQYSSNAANKKNFSVFSRSLSLDTTIFPKLSPPPPPPSPPTPASL